MGSHDADQECPTTRPATFTSLIWRFDDPVACQGSDEEHLARFRNVHSEIDSRIKTWPLSVSSIEASGRVHRFLVDSNHSMIRVPISSLTRRNTAKVSSGEPTMCAGSSNGQ